MADGVVMLDRMVRRGFADRRQLFHGRVIGLVVGPLHPYTRVFLYKANYRLS